MTAPPHLTIAVGDYPHTASLRRGDVSCPSFELAFADVRPVNRAFAPMVREGRYDICEMAIATALQAKAWGKPLVLLPVVLAARFQEAALLCLRESDIAGPADLVGRRIGVRAYSQTTGMWLRGVLQEEYGVRPAQVTWVTFEGAHVVEAAEPPFAERAPEGGEMLAMLRRGALDAVIVGNDVPADAGLRTVFPDPEAAGRRFLQRRGFMPINHLLVVRSEAARRHPALMDELPAAIRRSAAAAPSPGFTVVSTTAALAPAIRLAARYSEQQGLLPCRLSPESVWGP